MHGHRVRPGQAFTRQKLKFTGPLSDDRLLFAGLYLASGRLREVKNKTVAHETIAECVTDVLSTF